MFDNNILNQIRNADNTNVEDAEVVLPEPTNFEVDGAQCSVSFVPSKNNPSKYFVVLTANINGVVLSNRFATKSFGEDVIETAKETLTRSVKAINRIFAYRVEANKDEENHIFAKFDWETYSAFKEECSFGEFLPDVPEENEQENSEEENSEESTNDNLSCEINLKKADALEEFADLLDETWKEVTEKFCKESLYLFTVNFGKEEVSYISGTNIQQDGLFVYFEGNITSDDYARKVADVKFINKSKVPTYETEMLKKVIFSD